MKIILNHDVEKLGRKGDVVEVAAGYARNFLLPRNLAIAATRGALRQAEHLIKAREVLDTKQRAVLGELAEKISSQRLNIAVRVGDEGQMFGSVTTAEIADLLAKASGESIDRRKVGVETTIKSLGVHTYTVHLGLDVVASGTIEVVPDATSPKVFVPKAEEGAEPTDVAALSDEASSDGSSTDETSADEVPSDEADSDESAAE
ncbi:MAG TPA: 50S ribosomal protein L9 [Actinomycetota bacterium]|nr:50S ribosomal protein L9 [Actinomycetota bacterium]